MPTNAAPFHLRRAAPDDAASIAACVEAAYRPWVARLGHQPAPMQDNYTEMIGTRDDVTVAVDTTHRILGIVVLEQTPDGLLLENVAVAPTAQGCGVGKALLLHAERTARAFGHASVYLYTNTGMTENIALYAKIGYVEYARFEQHGHPRVFMRKVLGAPPTV